MSQHFKVLTFELNVPKLSNGIKLKEVFRRGGIQKSNKPKENF